MQDRRSFLKKAGAGVLTAAAYRRVPGANNRVRVGFIGIGLIGKRHLLDFKAQPDVDIAAICETYEPRLEEGVAAAGGSPERFKDFRKMYDRRDIDAVCVSTPDHWHALHTILACAAGKDVYVEKPLTHVVAEGRWMIEAMTRYKRIVQVGTQQRSGQQYQECVELLRNGHLGEMRNARIAAFRNIMPGFFNPVGAQPLSESDWQMWLGPAPYVKFDAHRCIYHFRWFQDYSGGQTTNLLAHDLDIVQWAMNTAPRSVAAMGGRYSLKGFGDTPDTVEAIIEFPGFVVNWSSSEISAGAGRGLEFRGTKGSLRINRAMMEVVPDKNIPADDQIPRFTQPPPSNTNPPPRTEAIKREGFEQVRDQFVPHVRNFLDCVKSRQQPIANLQSVNQGNITTHLVNIALKTRRTIHWDAEKEDIISDQEASRLLTKEYRAPWDRELKAALPKA